MYKRQILNPEQAQYYFLSGFTAKLAGTERGITEPTPTFSACFGAAFLSLHPTKYAEELVKKMNKVGAKAYLVNTGWNGSGKRISIKAVSYTHLSSLFKDREDKIIGIVAENRLETYASILSALICGKTYVILHRSYVWGRKDGG